MAKYSKAASKKVERALHKEKRGTLKNGGNGRKVTSRKQAIAIALSEAREAGAKVPYRSGAAAKKSASKKAASKRAGSKKSPSKKSASKKSSPKKSASKKTASKKSASKKSSTKRTAGRKSTTKKAGRPAKK